MCTFKIKLAKTTSVDYNISYLHFRKSDHVNKSIRSLIKPTAHDILLTYDTIAASSDNFFKELLSK